MGLTEHPDVHFSTSPMFKPRQRKKTWLVVIITCLVLAIVALLFVTGVLLSVGYQKDNGRSTETQPPVNGNRPPTTTSSITTTEGLHEVSSEITFEFYDGDPIEYEPAVRDKNSDEYLWWENEILPVLQRVFANLPHFETVDINYMKPGSLTVRFTCVFRAVNDLTPDSLDAYVLTFVDENGVVSGSKLGLLPKDNGISGGRWNEWQQWGACSVVCGTGQRYRSRTCQDEHCIGNSQEIDICEIENCPYWNTWASWGDCDVSCGWGERLRKRSCSTGIMSDCDGDVTDTQQCYLTACVTVATGSSWDSWEQWSICSSACDVGVRYRSRVCDPEAMEECVGRIFETEECNTHSCADVPWYEWGPWTVCTNTCGGGTRSRTRPCSSGDPRECSGEETMTENCNDFVCPPVHPSWSNWDNWSQCSKTCGAGVMERLRVCIRGDNCYGDEVHSRECNIQECTVPEEYGNWERWTDCTQSCDGGLRQRRRFCRVCPGAMENQNEECNTLPCVPVWTDWSAWGTCSETCDIGWTIRTRECHGVFDCDGPDGEVRDCDTNNTCSTEFEPTWNDWSSWSECEGTCSSGRRERTRVCNVPIGCVGSDRITQTCDLETCTRATTIVSTVTQVTTQNTVGTDKTTSITRITTGANTITADTATNTNADTTAATDITTHADTDTTAASTTQVDTTATAVAPTIQVGTTAIPVPITRVDTTAAPVPTTLVDATATPAPTTLVQTTAAPVPTTHVYTTTAPVPTTTRVDTTAALVPTTLVDTTAAPVPTTPVDTTAAPVPTTHVDTTAAPVPTTAPVDTTAAPVPTTHVDTTAAPVPTTHVDTTAAPPDPTTQLPTTINPTTAPATADIQFTASTASVTEGDGMVQLMLENSGTATGTVTLQTSDISTTAGTDYTTVTDMDIQVPSGGQVNVDITIAADDDTQCLEEFQVTISGSDVGMINSVMVTININPNEYLPITNDAFNASTEFYFDYFGLITVSLEARDANNLNEDTDADGSNPIFSPVWAPNTGDPEPHIMVDLGALTNVYVIDIQGGDASTLVPYGIPGISAGCCFVPSVDIAYGTDLLNTLDNIEANVDSASVKSINFDPHLSTRYLKLNLPSACQTELCAVRFRVKGCTV
ncbi:uncharacterized protein [Amphiura filiformis]|uniref:uncharacterized protein n=1 Tax=Amphiura filiformis TaxID=82378 RepID=UPI003B211AF3